MGVLGLLLPCRAHAQAQREESSSLAPLEHGSLLGVWGSEPLEPGRYALGLGMQVRPPLASEGAGVSGASGASGASTGAVSTLELLATIGLWKRLDISGGITAYDGSHVDWKSRAGAAGAALGDVRLIPRFRLAGGDSGAGFAIAVPIWFPAGNASAYRDQGLGIEPRALANYFSKHVTLSANAGYLFSQANETRAGWSKAITAGVGAEIPVVFSWSVLTELTSRLQLHDVGGEARLPIEARAAVRFSVASWGVQFGGGARVLGGASEADWRLLASLGFRPPEFARQRATVAPHAPELESGWDGCPDAASDEGDDSGCSREPEASKLAEEQRLQVAPEPPASQDTSEVQADNPLPAIREILYFEPNTMKLQPAQGAVLNAVEAQLRAAPPDAELVIEGHSDSLGPSSFNWALSRMRASTVRFYLMQRGISWRRLRMTGYGDSRPIEPDVEETGRARNRRVEFRLIRRSRN